MSHDEMTFDCFDTEEEKEAPNDGVNVRFEPVEGVAGVEVVDPIDRHRYTLYTDNPVTAGSVDTMQFEYPVDAAVGFQTTGIDLATVVPGNVHGADGEVISTFDHTVDEPFESGTYSVELFTPIKLYIQVEGPFTIGTNLASTRLAFESPTRVQVGARSVHQRPAATVTVTTDPEAMMRAVSTFGSALKTTSPERSYPSLRGHPPAIELGEELDIPAGLQPPETGLRLELPPEEGLGAVYVVAPLAYYLGARVEPGPIPRLVSDDGELDYALDRPLGFERTVEHMLKQVFFMDCLTRTEGGYSAGLHERTEFETTVDIDFGALYSASLPEQVAEYLEVPYEAVEPHLPEWKLTTHVAPNPTSVETLPFLVDDLAVVRSPRGATGRVDSPAAQSQAVNEFLRTGEEFTRSASASANVSNLVSPESVDSLEQAWVGEETPFGASKATTQAYWNRLDRTAKQGDIDITVVCNDPEMASEEGVVEDAYGDRDELPFDVSLKRGLSPQELSEVLQEDTDLLHYIGHIDAEGFRCPSGYLDARELNRVGVDAFFLNACTSYEQGMALIDAGSIGGVVTLSDVINSGAVRIGSTMARLLNRGFPLNAALDIARDESLVGSQYTVVGDGGLAVTQAESGTPLLYDIRAAEDGCGYEIELHAYPTGQFGMGTTFIPFLDESAESYLNAGRVDAFTLDTQECREFLNRENVPTRVDGQLRWSRDIELEEI
jgi:hypothetical protein